MIAPRQMVECLFAANNLPVPASRSWLLDAFLKDSANTQVLNAISENNNLLMEKWKMENRIADIMQQPVRILNATVGRPYEHRLNIKKLQWEDVSTLHFEGLDELGLHYNEQVSQLEGVPLKSGDFNITLKFKLQGETPETAFHEKRIPLIINPDPKSLWKNLPANREDPYWKEDDVTLFSPLGEKHILASSKRGRAHANVGSFREDDFAFKQLGNDWNLVVVADGAGSAKFSRKGSAIACESVVKYFSSEDISNRLTHLEELLSAYGSTPDEALQRTLAREVYDTLGKAVLQVHKELQEFAGTINASLKDLNTTLIFTLFKKISSSYALFSFGVGDCPIAVLSKDMKEVILMNQLDVGEFGGGTRFITMPEIFQHEKFASRFNVKVVNDFSFLIMMSDGIYDPKFVVEANLPKIEKWKELLADLAGKNEDGKKVVLDPSNESIVQQFSDWMDFWSQGNHDDRTLAIIF